MTPSEPERLQRLAALLDVEEMKFGCWARFYRPREWRPAEALVARGSPSAREFRSRGATVLKPQAVCRMARPVGPVGVEEERPLLERADLASSVGAYFRSLEELVFRLTEGWPVPRVVAFA